jgi:hypothetical protein
VAGQNPGAVLLLHPLRAAQRLIEARPKDIPHDWLDVYQRRVDFMGADSTSTDSTDLPF